MKRVLIVFSALGLVLAACGGGANKAASSGGDETAEKAGDNATDPGEQDDEAAGEGSSGGLKAKLLDASDLPRGFKRTLAEERDPQADKDDAQDSSDFCPELDKLDEEYPGDREAEANFERTTEQGGAYLNQQIARFKNVDQADEAFSAFEKGFANCKTFTEKTPTPR